MQKLIPILLEGIWLAGEARATSIPVPRRRDEERAIPRPRIGVNLSMGESGEHFVEVLAVSTSLVERVGIEVVIEPALGRDP